MVGLRRMSTRMFPLHERMKEEMEREEEDEVYRKGMRRGCIYQRGMQKIRLEEVKEEEVIRMQDEGKTRRRGVGENAG